jgi:hypothetical protein
MSAKGRTATRGKAARARTARRWSAAVTKHSHALALERAVFTWNDPRRIAASLKRSAERSRQRKGTPYQSAMSMLNFYINRAGRDLPARKRRILERAKKELRAQFGRADSASRRRKKSSGRPRA